MRYISRAGLFKVSQREGYIMLGICMVALLVMRLIVDPVAHRRLPVAEVKYVIERRVNVTVEARHVVTRRAFRTTVILADQRAAVAGA